MGKSQQIPNYKKQIPNSMKTTIKRTCFVFYLKWSS